MPDLVGGITPEIRGMGGNASGTAVHGAAVTISTRMETDHGHFQYHAAE